MQRLRHAGVETHVGEDAAAVHTDGEIVAMLSYLRHDSHRQCRQDGEE